MEKLFVYGTLRRGYGNHRYLIGSRFLCNAKTVEKYSMYVSGIPFVVKTPQVSRISGELYEVDDETISRIDRLEGHPSFYYREKVSVETEDGQEVSAWMYFFGYSPVIFSPSVKLIESGNFHYESRM